MEENRKHHSFRKGLICGVLISVLTVSVCGCGAAWMLGHLGFTALTSGGNAEEQAKNCRVISTGFICLIMTKRMWRAASIRA